MNRKHLYILCGLLVLIGVSVTAYRSLVLEFPLLPNETTATWRIETRLEFEAKGAPVRVAMMVPKSEPGLTLFNESFVSPGYGLVTSSPTDNRQAIFSKRTASGTQVIYHSAVIHRSLNRDGLPKSPPPRVVPDGFTEIQKAAARQIIGTISDQSFDTDSFARLLFSRLKDPRPGSPEILLMQTAATRAEVGVRIMASAAIAARVVNGIALSPDRRKAKLVRWVEIYDDDTWRPFDPDTNEFRKPKDHLAWWRGEVPLATLKGGRIVHTDIAIRQVFVHSLQSTVGKQKQLQNRLVEFSVFGLPLQTQEVYRLLLTVPIGIFLLVILRNVVGMRTFGTFMPVLIALAFRETQLLWGTILFTSVVAVGLLIRFYLEQLKLLLVPRLACVVIIVILVMTVISIVSHKLGFDRGLSVALFPIVILAMTIERMTVIWDEKGAKEALIQAVGSFFVAVLCYLVMNLDIVRHWVFVFPESLLLVLAATLALGRYSGYRLVELPRFRVLAGRK
ncbi:MAG: hypothetical protein ACI9JL_004569 [Paracoccaceae bacterium]|jgi:hypothetical protein